ncbi:hypothetical protein GCM10007094_01430 [Pseudovibrio japonicus]|uniref:Uncharacterized protein n=1 Tax=Pseudovibrio japonicus TaxID=366534 RepID=A0ABQ3DVF6_9HYPH|nr:hypothetical protein [Pseudovibrio japonicus]GHB17617.1 hypothetical protein GCM10007094_01430 [Pseudovibrio japonicus]
MRSIELRSHRYSITFFLAFFVTSFLTLTASAQTNTDNPIASALLESLQERGLTLVHVGPVTVNGEVLTIDGIEGYPTADQRKRFKIGELALSRATLENDGRLYIGAFAATDFEIDEPAFSFVANKIAITDLYLPNSASQDDLVAALPASLYSFAEIEGLLFQDRRSGQSMPIERITIDFDTENNGFPIIASIVVENIELNRSMFTLLQQQVLVDLGLEQVTAGIEFQGVWNGDTGQLTIPSAAVVLQDLFGVQTSLELQGLTAPVIQQFSELATRDHIIALDLLQNVAISTFNLSIIDEGGLDDLLDRQAQQHGQSRGAYVAQLTARIDEQIARIPDQSKQLEFSQAVIAFLQDPQNLTLSAAPASPIGIAQIIGVAAFSPVSIISLLGIGLEANVD